MTAAAGDSRPLTYFAPPERAGVFELRAAQQAFLRNRLAVALLEAIPDLALVLNPQRQVVAVNQRLLQALDVRDADALVGLRPGELVGCVHAECGPGGCGTSKHCSVCGAVNAVLDCLESHQVQVRECRIRTQRETDGGALDLEVQASYLAIEAVDLVIVVMRDISAEKRRHVLERAFFHDVLNILNGLQAVVYLLEDPNEAPELKAEYQGDLRLLADQLTEEVRAHRQLMAAEQGELVPEPTWVRSDGLVREVVELYRRHGAADGRILRAAELPPVDFETDPVLLRRVLGNLVKNALEASLPGDTVTLGAQAAGDQVAFWVHNPGVMPDDVQKQIFQRSFSTKGGPGRGIGTHSAKLLTERYLGGKVNFVSTEPEGTTFMIRLPLKLAVAQTHTAR